MNSLVAKQVTYEYRNAVQTVRAVNGVSCDFQQGLVYALVGASGSGKTTFLSLLAGLDVPTSGTIELDGESTTKMNRDSYRLNHVSVIYQNFNLFQHLTVLENAAYPLYVRKMTKKKADELAREKLLQVGLKEDQFKRLPNMLSGGSSSVWQSPGRWHPAARSSLQTSPRAIWTARTAKTLWKSCKSWHTKMTAALSSSPTIPLLQRQQTWCCG